MRPASMSARKASGVTRRSRGESYGAWTGTKTPRSLSTLEDSMTPVTDKKKVPLLDMRALHQPIREEVLAALARVVDSNAFIMGEDVKQLEKSIAAYSRVPYAIGCASGSDALLLALMAAGVQHGDAVLTTPFTFFATAGSIVRAGATPVFVDIDPATYNIDPQALADTLRRTPRAKAVMPVHLYGGCADMDPIMEVSRSRGCMVIEDCLLYTSDAAD